MNLLGLSFFVLASTLDVLSTRLGLDRGGHEANPAMAWVMSHSAVNPIFGLIAAKVMSTLMIWGALRWLTVHRAWPARGVLVTWIVSSIPLVAVAAHNIWGCLSSR